MLNRLQKDVESEETRWKSQLRQKENEVTNLKIELNDMKAKLIADKEVSVMLRSYPRREMHLLSRCFSIPLGYAEGKRGGSSTTKL